MSYFVLPFCRLCRTIYRVRREHGEWRIPRLWTPWDRKDGKWYALAAVEEDTANGIAAVEVGDIVIPDDPAFEGERMLMLFCPRCLERYPAAHCIIQVRQSNRFWALDEKTTGDPFVFEGEHYVSAGMIMDSEEFTCGRCSWAANIDKNRVRPR